MGLNDSEEIRKARERAVIGRLPPHLPVQDPQGHHRQGDPGGADSFESAAEDWRRHGTCGAQRCGPMVRGMLGEEVATCAECGLVDIKIDRAARPPALQLRECEDGRMRCGAQQRRMK
jgi:hypothetical protein